LDKTHKNTVHKETHYYITANSGSFQNYFLIFVSCDSVNEQKQYKEASCKN